MFWGEGGCKHAQKAHKKDNKNRKIALSWGVVGGVGWGGGVVSSFN